MGDEDTQLLHQPEEQAFWTLASIADDFFPVRDHTISQHATVAHTIMFPAVPVIFLETHPVLILHRHHIIRISDELHCRYGRNRDRRPVRPHSGRADRRADT